MGMRICKSEPMATSKWVRKAAPPRHKFSLEVSSSKAKPRASRPHTRKGKRTTTLRSDLCGTTLSLDPGSLVVSLMGWILPTGRFAIEEAVDIFHDFGWCAR
jgi:hypothetical protein